MIRPVAALLAVADAGALGLAFAYPPRTVHRAGREGDA